MPATKTLQPMILIDPEVLQRIQKEFDAETEFKKVLLRINKHETK